MEYHIQYQQEGWLADFHIKQIF